MLKIIIKTKYYCTVIYIYSAVTKIKYIQGWIKNYPSVIYIKTSVGCTVLSVLSI